MPSKAYAIHTCDHCHVELHDDTPPVGLIPTEWSTVHLTYRDLTPDTYTLCDNCLAEMRAFLNVGAE